MELISDPPNDLKIQKMKERVRWLHPSIVARGIDQTSMVIDDGNSENSEFSFMVIGDSGSKTHKKHHPQRRIAELMLNHRQDCSFVLHTGDVIYTVGSREYYPQNFIEPYREFLQGGENPRGIRYDRMVFDTPILPVLGNHDYYNVPLMHRLLMGSSLAVRRWLGYKNDIEVGWHGSYEGDAYARAFLDYLAAIASEKELESHLDCHYTAKTDSGRCLRYQPGSFTRLPNRYYTFRYGGIDFFALDSSTINTPLPLPTDKEGEALRHQLSKRRTQIEQEELEILRVCKSLNPDILAEAEQLDQNKAKLEEIEEVKIDIEKQLVFENTTLIDFEQLDWLGKRLIESWNNSEVRGRIIYFHHPPYVTEASKWHQGETLAIRRRLRSVFDAVAENLGYITKKRAIVDLILNGHAHCLEYLRTTDTGTGDSNINCLICGGSGHYPRRQREQGPELMEISHGIAGNSYRKIADSMLFVGRNSYDSQEHLPYSFVRIDVKGGTPPKLIVRPYVTEFHGEWYDKELEPFVI